jgi:hypothetical protein
MESARAASFEELLQRLPADANALVVLNVEKVKQSPLAQREGWHEKHLKAFAAAPLLLPPSAQRFVLGSHLDLETMTPTWEVAVMEVSTNPSVDEIAGRTGGTIDRLQDLDATEIPSDAFVVRFAPHLYGVHAPANRQWASRWVRSAEAATSVSLAPYLVKAASYAETAGTEIIMALDLADAVRPQDIRAAMEGSEAAKKNQIDLDALSSLLGSVQGVTLGVRTGEKAYGKLKVEFGQDAAIMKGWTRELILEVLGEAGAMIDDFETWKEEVEGSRISIEGYLSPSGMRRLFSVLELDTTGVAKQGAAGKTAAPATGQSAAETVAYTSREYFQAVSGYLNDLRRERGARSIGQYGLWFQKYARKIDRLPILNVDPDLVTFGQQTASHLRDATASIQGIGIRSAARQAQIVPEANVTASYSGFGPMARYGAFGGYRVFGGYGGYAEATFRDVSADRRTVRTEERSRGASEARQIMQQIENEMADMRRKMTEKYQIEF